MLVFPGIIMLPGGVFSMYLSTKAFGDIGAAIFFAGLGMMLSGLCVLIINGRLHKKSDKESQPDFRRL